MNLEATKKEEAKSSVIPVIEFNPAVLLLEELKGSYGHLATFHYDRYGGDVIAVKLKQVNKSFLGAELLYESLCL